MLTPDEELSRVLNAAQWEAVAAKKQKLESTHLLLGLFHPPLSAAGRALYRLGMEPKRERLAVPPPVDEEAWPPRIPVAPQTIQLSREAERLLALAEKEAQARGEVELTPSHLLLGLLRTRQGDAALLLRMLGITEQKARAILYPQ